MVRSHTHGESADGLNFLNFIKNKIRGGIVGGGRVGAEYMHGTMTSRLSQLVREGWFGVVLWATVIDSRGHWWSDPPTADPASIWKLDRSRGGGIIIHCLPGPIAEASSFRPPRNALSFYPPSVPDNVTLMPGAQGGAVCNFQVFHKRAPTYYREVPRFQPDWRKVPRHEFAISLVGTPGSCEMQIYDKTLHLFGFDQNGKDTVFERTEVFGPQRGRRRRSRRCAWLLRRRIRLRGAPQSVSRANTSSCPGVVPVTKSPPSSRRPSASTASPIP